MQQSDQPKKYPVLNFRNEFCPLLMQRIYPSIRWNAELGNGKFLIFLNITNRSSEESLDKESPSLIYGGVHVQRNFLEKEKNADLDEDWEKLNEGEILPEKSKEGSGLYDQFRNGQLGLKDLYIGDLKQYFSKYLKENTFDNKLQEHEYPILNYHFSIEKDHFLSLPLIFFGKLDGILHIIFEHGLLENLNKVDVWKNLIRNLSSEYENLFLDWDLVGENLNLLSLVQEELEYVTSDEFANAVDTNKFFQELNSRQFYLDSYDYYLERVRQNNAIPIYIINQHRKRAIISILIDSYAHNISAHSLTVLKWWFQQRASNNKMEEKIAEIDQELPFQDWGPNLVTFLMKKFPDVYAPEEIGLGLRYDLARWYNMMEKRTENNVFRAVRDQFFPLEEQLTPLFKFLLEKGAFWSGVTRDQQFGGEIHNMYSVLWNDFISNPLYLGTIAYSEGITRLNICIRIYSDHKYKGKKDPYFWNYKVKKNKEGTPLDGVLATIDVGGAPFGPLQHRFVSKGARHNELKKALEECEVFFPGGIVGKHAFFTLVENEIRNVKHFAEKDRKIMQKDGLNLVIGIRPGYVSSRLDVDYDIKATYKVGVWLGHFTRFEQEHDQEHLVMRRFNRLLEDIITPESNEARLGGTYQDKICAAMLFNNTFLSVQRLDTNRDRVYYPWVTSAFSTGLEDDGVSETDFEVNYHNYREAPARLMEGDLPLEGYFKKHIHLWRGDFIFQVGQDENLEVENVNRFRIVNLPASNDDLRKNLLKAGAIRILEQKSPNIQPAAAYHQWLSKWIGEDYFALKLLQGHTEVGYIFFDETGAQYFSKTEYFQLDAAKQDEYGEYPESSLKFAHQSSNINQTQSDVLSIRSHGVLREKFFKNVQSVEDFAKGKIADLRLYELIEVLKTRLCIFDKRIADRVKSEKRDLLSRQLGCEIYDEYLNNWKKVRVEGIDRYHFIIMHLSFIEGMENKKGQRYGEEGIVDFIEEQLDNKLADNCILVITTGRGRTQWWRKLENSEYATHTTFRPVESLIEAVEKAVLKNDDIELKYNLIKVLFGS